ncbi:cold-shock protein [Kangiella sp.]|uniref:cold-shock protein n=1 Tax=Kangiella sp. TaxID=1920245 RepID=UPI0019AD73C6|nr:cold shock domain-containing protein [Kangiella sp.]MBD3652353.1 cold shock domain-containing protein [Kangiella sp.]
MKGKVKWFSEEKGYGFITGQDGADRFVSVRSVIGADLPRNGYIVDFEHIDSAKGPQAVNVKIIATPQSAKADDRITCLSCSRKMIPRVITGPPLIQGGGSWTPVPKRSICPFCGQTYKKFPPSLGEIFGVIVFVIVALILLNIFLNR